MSRCNYSCMQGKKCNCREEIPAPTEPFDEVNGDLFAHALLIVAIVATIMLVVAPLIAYLLRS